MSDIAEGLQRKQIKEKNKYSNTIPPTHPPIPSVSQYCISGRRSPKGHWHGGDLSYYYQLATALHNFGSGWSPTSIIPKETINRKPCWESHWILCWLLCQSIQLERLQASPILLENPIPLNRSQLIVSLCKLSLSLSHTHTHRGTCWHGEYRLISILQSFGKVHYFRYNLKFSNNKIKLKHKTDRLK